MEEHASLNDRLAVLSAAMPAFTGIAEVKHQASAADLPGVVMMFDTIIAEASRGRALFIAEAVQRGDIDTTTTAWIREHAPSLRQGGATQTARLVTELTKGGPLWNPDNVGPDPDSPLGIVWDAVTETPATECTAEAPIPPLTTPNAMAVLSEVTALKPRLQPEAVPTVTRILVDLAREWGPAHMRQLRPRMLAEYGLDGELDDLNDKLAKAAHLSSPQAESGGLTKYSMALTPAQAATLEAAIGPLSAPRQNPETGERDDRPTGQRRVEALTDICARAVAVHHGAGGEGPTGAYAALHIAMTLEDLRKMTGCTEVVPGSTWSVFGGGSTSSTSTSGTSTVGTAQGSAFGETLGTRAEGTLISPEILRRLACAADLIPSVLGSAGELLDQGQEIRLFSKAQRRALARRDGHCTYPRCDIPASWSRAHHVLHWFDGGASDLDNAALLCERHHTLVHIRGLWADVRAAADEHGRHVHWDLTDGSYERELERRHVEKAANDPPRLTPALVQHFWAQLAQDPNSSTMHSRRYDDCDADNSGPYDDLTEEEWALLRSPLIWDEDRQAFLDPPAAA